MVSIPRVSVALCTHNGARFIAEQFESILRQTQAIDEIVLSDDASSDGTVEIAEQMVVAFRAVNGWAPHLVVLRNSSPLRVTKNFEQALITTSGDLVALCDQDDVWHPQRIEQMVGQFRDPNLVFLFGNARQVDEKGRYLGHDLFTALGMTATERHLIETGQAFRQFMRRNLATGATVMIRRSLVDQAAPIPESWLHDEWLAVVAASFNGVCMYDDPRTDYRQHDSNQVGMERLGISQKLAMFTQPRTERNRRLFLRARALAERIDTFDGVSDMYRGTVQEKYAFEQARQKYPAVRILRLIPILRQLVRGRYHCFGTGLKDAIRNLIQPV